MKCLFNDLLSLSLHGPLVSRGTFDFAAPRLYLADRALFCGRGKGYHTLNKREDEY